MPTSISNPASFSSVRTAFNAEGYGLSTSLFAYRQGGGIVPATTPFNVIGAGTGGDPLQLSQFNGFSVPSIEVILDTQTVTSARYYQAPADKSPGVDRYGFTISSYIYPHGSVSDGTSNLYSGAPVVYLVYNANFPALGFSLTGNHANSGWTTLKITHSSTGNVWTYPRTGTSAQGYDSGLNVTSWSWGFGSTGITGPSDINPFTNITSGQNIYVVTFIQ